MLNHDFIDHTKGKFDLRNFFSGALTRARKGSTIGNKFDYLCMGTIPSNQNVWFKFLATSSNEWNSIFAIYTQIFENYFREVFFPLSPECLKFLVEWFGFWESFRKSGNFSGKILYQLPPFPSFFSSS